MTDNVTKLVSSPNIAKLKRIAVAQGWVRRTLLHFSTNYELKEGREPTVADLAQYCLLAMETAHEYCQELNLPSDTLSDVGEDVYRELNKRIGKAALDEVRERSIGGV